MTEDDYLNCSNLARLRSAIVIIEDIFPLIEQDADECHQIVVAIVRMRDRLSRLVKIEEES